MLHVSIDCLFRLVITTRMTRGVSANLGGNKLPQAADPKTGSGKDVRMRRRHRRAPITQGKLPL